MPHLMHSNICDPNAAMLSMKAFKKKKKKKTHTHKEHKQGRTEVADEAANEFSLYLCPR